MPLTARVVRVAWAWPLAAALACGLTGCGGSSAPGRGAPQISSGRTATVTYCHDQHATVTEPAGTTSTRLPAVVYLHGGSWIGGDSTSGGFIIDAIAPALNAAGFVTVSVNYRLGPEAQWPAQIEDAKCVVRYLRANARSLRIATEHIGVWGHSAGGHLAGLLGTAPPSAGWDVGAYPSESSRVQAVADLAGVSNLSTLGEEGFPGQVKAAFLSLLRSVPTAGVPAALVRASPITYVAPGDPPFLIIHADNDGIVPLAQSIELAAALEHAGVPTRFVTVHGGGHSLADPGGKPDEKEIETVVVGFFVTELGEVGADDGALRWISAPAHPAQDVGMAARCASGNEVAFGLGYTFTPDRLAVAGRATLHAAARVVEPAEWCATVSAFLGFVAVAGSGFLAPADPRVVLAGDDHRVGQAADAVAHLAAAVRTDRHGASFCPTVWPIIPGGCDCGADGSGCRSLASSGGALLAGTEGSVCGRPAIRRTRRGRDRPGRSGATPAPCWRRGVLPWSLLRSKPSAVSMP